jgi:transposase
MAKIRKSHPPSLKAKVAVEAIKAHKTAAQIAQVFGVHPTQVRAGRNKSWRTARHLRQRPRADAPAGGPGERQTLYQIGQLKVELDFLTKRAGLID